MELDGASSGRARICLLVLGMHRSGTSALTRVLSLQGAALPKHILGAGPGNEAGHWEPEPLVQLHDQMLVEAGSSWDDWRKLDLETQLPSGRLDYYKAEIRRLIEDEFDDAPLFVVKEPRICRFVPLYREILAGMGAAVRPVIIFRHPMEVAASLAARNEIAPAQSHLYWLRHVLDLERGSRNLPRAITSYEDLLGDWRSAIATFEHQLGLVWPRRIDDAAPEIDSFLSSTHRHHAAADPSLPCTPSDSDWVSFTHSAINRLRSEAAAAMAELDVIYTNFSLATNLFGASLIAERTARNKAIAEQHHAFSVLRESALAEHAARQDLVDRQTAQITIAEKQNSDLRDKLRNLQAASVESYAALKAIKDELVAAKAEIEVLHRKLEADLAESRKMANRLSQQTAIADELKTQISAITNSKSWKATRPLRKLRGLVRAATKSAPT